MQDNWLDFLAGEGGLMQGNTLHHFSDTLVENEAVVSDWLTALPDYAVVEAGSADAADFLQAQFCNDLGLLNEADGASSAQLNGYCDPKGRLLGLFHLLRHVSPSDASDSKAFRLLLPTSVAERFTKRLAMFVLRSDVKIALQPSVHVLAAAGSKAVAALDSLLAGSTPEKGISIATLEPYQAVAGAGLQILRLPAERWVILTESHRAQDDWKILATALQPVGGHRWTLACIKQGEPSIHAETVEKFIPQMLNLQSIDALSFKKGCYPGQEIVARMQYLGKLKRNMRRISFDSEELPDIGTSLTSGADADAGAIVSVAFSEPGRCEGLAVLKIDVDVSTLAINGMAAGPGSNFRELEMPYPVVIPGCDVKAKP